MKNENFQVGIVFFVVGLLFLIGGWDLSLGSFKEIGLGAAPKFFSIALSVTGILIAIQK